jgi:hypothetical protein
MRRASVLLVLVLLVPVAAAATAGRTATLRRLHVDVTGQSHHPKLGHPWTYQVSVTDAATGKPVACLIHIEVTFGGAPVGQIGRHHVLSGGWTETIPATGKNAFPPAAVGQHVVWRATATAPGYRKGVGLWPISVVK